MQCSRRGHTRDWQNCGMMFSILLSLPFPFVLSIVWELTSSSIVRRAYRESLAGSSWRKDADNRTWFICLIYVGLFDFAKLTSSLKKDVRWNFQLKGAKREWEISVHSSAKLSALILPHAGCSAPALLCVSGLQDKSRGRTGETGRRPYPETANPIVSLGPGPISAVRSLAFHMQKKHFTKRNKILPRVWQFAFWTITPNKGP